MSSQNEEKITKLFNYPYDAFLMLRLEFNLIFEDELEAKLLRIIEKYVEQERKRIYRETINKTGNVPDSPLDVTKDIWVEISYKTFMSDLHGKVTSVNTIKRGLKKLENWHVIFRQYEQKKQYDAPRYKIHASVLQMLLDVVGKPGYQRLIPSIFDTLKKLPPQELTPSEAQSLIPSNPTSSTGRVSTADTNYNNTSNNKENNKREDTSAHVSDTPNVVVSASAENDAPLSLASLSLEDLQAELARRQQAPSTPSTPQEPHLPIVTATDIPTSSEQGMQEQGMQEQGSVVGVATGKSEDVLMLPPSETTSSTKRTRKKTEQPTLLPEEATRLEEEIIREKQEEARRVVIRARIEKRRGYVLKGKKFLNECVYVKKLAEDFDDRQIEAIHIYLFERDFKWSKPDNKFKIGAYEIYENAQNVAQILREERIAKEQGKTPTTNILPFSRPQQPQPPTYQRMPSKDELRASKAGV